MANRLLEIKECITFVFLKTNEGKYIPVGTGFFVGVKNENNPQVYTVYLVTAKHVVQDIKGEYYKSISIRLNKKDGTAQYIDISLASPLVIRTHKDENVDIALFECLPDQQVFEFKLIQDDLIATKEIIKANDISEGDDVFFSGLFTSHLGQNKNQPIVRFGKVALLTDEKVEWKEKGKPIKSLNLYLMECQSFGGNSGSPVFFQSNPLYKANELKPSQIYLAGIMKGNFNNGSEIQTIETNSLAYSLENIGIAAVVPAYELHEILFSTDLIEKRKKDVAPVTEKKD